MLSRARLEDAIAAWREREVTSTRMLVTAVGLLGVVAPIAMFFVVVGPTVTDRLGSLGFAALALALGLFSLWEAKDPELASRRPDDRDGRP